MIRNLRTEIRYAISTQLNGASPSARPAGFRFMLNQTIKGVPTVARTDRLFKTKEAGTDMKFRSKQVGDLSEYFVSFLPCSHLLSFGKEKRMENYYIAEFF